MLGAALAQWARPCTAAVGAAAAAWLCCRRGAATVAPFDPAAVGLVGLDLDGTDVPEVGVELTADGRKTGELTSVAVSPASGSIALGYVRREHAEPGTAVTYDGGRAEVVALPFVPLGGERAEST